MHKDNYYLKTDEVVIDQFGDEYISSMYAKGYMFGRIQKGYMSQTRSLRINLENFELNSENRRILRKTEEIDFDVINLPVDAEDYDWRVHKLGKDFYSEKFGDNTMSASKIKEMIVDGQKSNFNMLFSFKHTPTPTESEPPLSKERGNTDNPDLVSRGEHRSPEIGYCICYLNSEILHYSYPFYDLGYENRNLGMGMMIRATKWAKENGKKYVYLGSVVTVESKYKLQFNNLEWWDGEEWNEDLEGLKGLLTEY